jgi:DNA topoisomerase-3
MIFRAPPNQAALFDLEGGDKILENEMLVTERKGLGTPATRAGIIEKLVKGGFIERKKRQLHVTEKGANLVAILPETLTSPLLTVEWETKLKAVERGELADTAFIAGIAAMTRELVAEHSAPIAEYRALFAPPRGEPVGKCPRCGSDVYEGKKGFFCSGAACKFAVWRDNRFFAAKHKTIDKKTVSALLSEGRVFISDLYSEKTGKTYGATVALDDMGKYVNFKLEFEKGDK